MKDAVRIVALMCMGLVTCVSMVVDPTMSLLAVLVFGGIALVIVYGGR